MPVPSADDAAVSAIAAAIAAPARAQMLYCLMDGRARTSTELAIIAGVTPSTASVHLHRLKRQRLVKVITQGKHRYYSLAGADVAATLEALGVLAGARRSSAVTPEPPSAMRAARSCYDHIAGILGVALYDRFEALGWLSAASRRDGEARELNETGTKAFAALGIDVDSARTLRRRFAYACLDWSERRPHLGGALGAALLDVALKRKWVLRQREGRALTLTSTGQRELRSRFGVRV
jgi:DNA-binding transcriptional ArsR family regulator